MRSKSDRKKENRPEAVNDGHPSHELDNSTLPQISEKRLEEFRKCLAGTAKIDRVMERQLEVSPDLLRRAFIK